MRRIKSAPADICKMINRKIPIIEKKSVKNNIIPFLTNNDNNNDKNDKQNTKDIIIKKSNIEQKRKIVSNKRQIYYTISGIISDTFSQTGKYIPEINNYYYQLIIEFFNNFMINKFTLKNLENLIFSLIIRIIVSNIYHEIIIKTKENINIIK